MRRRGYTRIDPSQQPPKERERASNHQEREREPAATKRERERASSHQEREREPAATKREREPAATKREREMFVCGVQANTLP